MVYIKSMLGQPALWLLGWMVLLGQFVNPTAVAQSPSLYSRQANFYPIGGIPKVVERRSITVLQSQYPDIFNMLILAWANVAARQENLDLSYYQVAGSSRVLAPALISVNQKAADSLVQASMDILTSRGNIPQAPPLIHVSDIALTGVFSS